jgi:hypothetical protein
MVYTMAYKTRQSAFEKALAELDKEAAVSGGGGGKNTRSTKRS